MSEQLNTVQPIVAPIVDGQAPIVDTEVVAPVVDSQADPAKVELTPLELPVETPVTPPVGQEEVKVDESNVTNPGKPGNEFGTWEDQYNKLRPELTKKAEAAKEFEAKFQAQEKESLEMKEWIDKYSPVLEKVLGDAADPELKKKILEGMQDKPLTPQSIKEMVTAGIQSYEQEKVSIAKASELQKAQDDAYNSFMKENPAINSNPLLVQKVLKTMQAEDLPLTKIGYNAAKALIGIPAGTPAQPDNTAQESIIEAATITGGPQVNGAGEVESNKHWNLKEVKMP